MYRPFLRMDDPFPDEILTDALVHVLAERGLARFSVSALARWMKVTPAAVLNTKPRKHVVEAVTARFGDRWLAWGKPDLYDDIPARLPQTEDEIHGVRVWHALGELARGETVAGRPNPTEILADIRRRERMATGLHLEHRLGRRATEDEVRATCCLVEGLRLHLALPGADLSHDQARRLLTGHVSRLHAVRPPEPGRQPTERPGAGPAA